MKIGVGKTSAVFRGQVVSVLDFYSDDPNSKPAEDYSFDSVTCLKSKELNKKGGVWPIFKD